MHVYPCVYLPTTGVSIFKILVRTKILPSISELPTRLTYFISRCVLRITLILFKDFVLTLFPSLRIPRCHVGMDDIFILYHLRVIFGIRHQHLLVFHPTFRVSHVCNFQLPLLSHMNFTIQLVTNEVRLRL